MRGLLCQRRKSWQELKDAAATVQQLQTWTQEADPRRVKGGISPLRLFPLLQCEKQWPIPQRISDFFVKTLELISADLPRKLNEVSGKATDYG